jgi:CRISPR-associated protein Cmr6
MSTYRQHLDNVYHILAGPSENTYQTHAGLWFDRFIEKQDRETADSRINLIKYVSTLSIPETYQAFYKRWEKTLKTETEGAKTRVAIVKGRMIVGLGDESVLETSITLHQTYGVPYIPGSALKGLAASYAHQRLADPIWNKEGEAYNVIFGNTDNAGYITFFDALYIPDTGRPKSKQPLYPDVITVHHKEYYQGKDNAPADWDSPTPIPFLSTTGNYLIALAAPDLGPNSPWITKTFEILGYALKDMGIGAKTSSGYGRMELAPDNTSPATPNVQVEEKYVRPSTLPTFRLGQDVPGVVMKPADVEEIRQSVSIDDACAVLQFQAYPFKEVLIIIPNEYAEAATWAPGNTRICHFVREEARGRCTVLVCKPRPPRSRGR